MAKNSLKVPEIDLRRRSSDSSMGLMDTAEDLVDQLDNVAEILAEIDEKYPKVNGHHTWVRSIALIIIIIIILIF